MKRREEKSITKIVKGNTVNNQHVYFNSTFTEYRNLSIKVVFIIYYIAKRGADRITILKNIVHKRFLEILSSDMRVETVIYTIIFSPLNGLEKNRRCLVKSTFPFPDGIYFVGKRSNSFITKV